MNCFLPAHSSDFVRGLLFGIGIALEVSGVALAMARAAGTRKRANGS